MTRQMLVSPTDGKNTRKQMHRQDDEFSLEHVGLIGSMEYISIQASVLRLDIDFDTQGRDLMWKFLDSSDYSVSYL